jgi:hypothetical protein
MIFDQRKFSSGGEGEISEKFYKFNSGFPRFSNIMIGPELC